MSMRTVEGLKKKLYILEIKAPFEIVYFILSQLL